MDEQSKLAERILDHVADAVVSTDRSGAIIRWNYASSALFGILLMKCSARVSN
jgi:hypothetical protein